MNLRHWFGIILKAIYTNLTEQCSWQLKFRLYVSLGTAHFLSVRTSEITFPNTEIFELCSPDNMKDDSQIPSFFYLCIYKAKSTALQNSNCFQLRRQERSQVFLEYFMPAMSTEFMMNINQARGADGLQKKLSINSNKKRFNKRSINFMLSTSILWA